MHCTYNSSRTHKTMCEPLHLYLLLGIWLQCLNWCLPAPARHSMVPRHTKLETKQVSEISKQRHTDELTLKVFLVIFLLVWGCVWFCLFVCLQFQMVSFQFLGMYHLQVHLTALQESNLLCQGPNTLRSSKINSPYLKNKFKKSLMQYPCSNDINDE